MDLEVIARNNDQDRMTFFENKFLVSKSDLKSGEDFEKLRKLRSTVQEGRFDEPFVVLQKAQFVKLIDGEKLRDDLIDAAYEALEPKGFEDDIFQIKLTNAFKLMCSYLNDQVLDEKGKLKKHITHLGQIGTFQGGAFGKSIIMSNIRALPPELKTLAVGELFC